MKTTTAPLPGVSKKSKVIIKQTTAKFLNVQHHRALTLSQLLHFCGKTKLFRICRPKLQKRKWTEMKRLLPGVTGTNQWGAGGRTTLHGLTTAVGLTILD